VHPDKSQFGMLQRAATRCTVVQYLVCCIVLQLLAVCCIVLQLLAVCCSGLVTIWSDVHHQDFVNHRGNCVCTHFKIRSFQNIVLRTSRLEKSGELLFLIDSYFVPVRALCLCCLSLCPSLSFLVSVTRHNAERER